MQNYAVSNNFLLNEIKVKTMRMQNHFNSFYANEIYDQQGLITKFYKRGFNFNNFNVVFIRL